MLRTSIAILLSACGYAAAGNVSVLLAVPMGYASIIWPASGIALAAVLLLGYRVLPGVFLGSVLTNLWRAMHDGAVDPLGSTLAIAGGIGLGAMAQAFAGAWLVRRFVGPPGPLDTPRDVARFLCLGALSCLVNTIWGPLALALAGAGSLQGFVDNALAWWAGDVLGVVVVTPLLLTLGAEPRAIWRSRRISLAIPLLGVLVLTIGLFALAGARERDQLVDRLQKQAEEISDDLALEMQARLGVLQVFAGLLEPDELGDPAFIERMTARVRKLAPEFEVLQQISWIPTGDPDPAAAPERLDGQPRPMRLLPRSEDEASAPGWEQLVRSRQLGPALLQAARDGGQPVITAPLDLLVDGRSQRGLLALVPVYLSDEPHDTVAERRRNLVGFVLGEIPLESLIGGIVSRGRIDDLVVSIHQRDASGAEAPLYIRPLAAPVKASLRVEVAEEIAGRSWYVALTPTLDALRTAYTWYMPVIWVAVLLVASLLGALLLLVTGRTARAEAKAAEQAGALDQARIALEQVEFLRRLADSNVVGILLLDRGGRIHEANDAFLDMVGYDRDALVRGEVRWDEISPGEWKEADRSAFAQADEKGAAPAWERECLRPDGSRVPVMLGVARLESDAGRYAAFVVDLSKVKETEAELTRQARELETYKLIVNSAPVIIFAKEYSEERQGVYILVNPACNTVIETGPSVGRTDFDAFRADEAAALQAADRKVLEEGKPVIVEERGFDARVGKMRYVLSTKLPLLDAEGKPFAVAGISVDITEQKQLTEQLAALVDAIPDAMFRIGADGMCLDFKSNPGGLLAGREAEEVIGSNLFEAPVPDDIRALIRWSVGEAIRTGEVQEIEYSVETPQGLRHYEERAVKSGPDEVVLLLRDITEARRTREALQQANVKLQAANEELREFAYVASHDLQEPLRTVRSFAEMLARRYEDAFDERGRKWLDLIVSGTQRMRDLIEDLLAYSRAGTAETTEPVDTRALVAGILDDSRASIEAAGARIEVGALPTVMASETELRQVFLNLISNALKFRRPQVAPRITVTAVPAGRGWRFSVADNGIGIAPEYHERIFQVFQRLHGRDEYPGTGIGLALVKKIVERRGGAISVRSSPEQGTEFCFTLPAGARAEDEDARPAGPPVGEPVT